MIRVEERSLRNRRESDVTATYLWWVWCSTMRFTNAGPITYKSQMLIVLYINVWYAYLHLPYKKQPNVGKYTIHWVFGTLFHMQDTISRHASPMPRQKNCWVAFIHIPICMIFASSRNAARGLKNGKFDVSLWKKIYRNGIWGARGWILNIEQVFVVATVL